MVLLRPCPGAQSLSVRGFWKLLSRKAFLPGDWGTVTGLLSLPTLLTGPLPVLTVAVQAASTRFTDEETKAQSGEEIA